MPKRSITADDWSRDVREQRVFLEIHCPSAKNAVARLEAVANELDVRMAVVDRLRDKLHAQQKNLDTANATISSVIELLGGAVEADGCFGDPVVLDVARRLVAMLNNARRERDVAHKKVIQLQQQRSELDCQYAGGWGESDGASHCPPDRPCMRCRLERLEETR